MAPPLLNTQDTQEPVEPDIQRAKEKIEQDNDDKSNKIDQTEQDKINNQIIRRNEQRSNSLEDLVLENVFREQTPDNHPISQKLSLAGVNFNKAVKMRPISTRESIYSPRTGM